MSVGSRIQIPHTPNPSQADAYSYATKRGRPMLFQVVDPTNQPIWPFLLAMHVNPKSFNESFSQSKNVVMTYGGFVEFVWPEELDSISASASTGGFIGPFAGLTSGSDGDPQGKGGRHRTMAWERQEDLLDLFRNNGNVYNGAGQPVIRGRVMCIYDRGIYIGHFSTFSVNEDDEHAYSFELNWEFKVESSIYLFSGAYTDARPVPRPSVFSSAETDRVAARLGLEQGPTPKFEQLNPPSAIPGSALPETQAEFAAAEAQANPI